MNVFQKTVFGFVVIVNIQQEKPITIFKTLMQETKTLMQLMLAQVGLEI